MDVSTLCVSLDPHTGHKIINNTYAILRKIGEGQYGKVLEANVVGSSPPSHVAIKTVRRADKSRLLTRSYSTLLNAVKREISILRRCTHPNIVRLILVIDDAHFDKILLVLEYCARGEVRWKHYNHFREKHRAPNSRKRLSIQSILRDVVNGLEYLHDYKHIVHRDLKPSNLLIDADNTVKISDFGVSVIMDDSAHVRDMQSTMGTPAFYAPEMCQYVHNRLSMIDNKNHPLNQVLIDQRVDIWALGVVLYALMYRALPFSGANEFELGKNIVNQKLYFPESLATSASTDQDYTELTQFRDLVTRILEKNPDSRFSLLQIKKHPFTTLDENEKERKRFYAFNAAIIKNERAKEQLDLDHGSSTLNKVRNLFSIGKPVSSPKPLEPPPPIFNLEENMNLLDDLLDSYLDDSSMGSDVEVDTTDILGSANPGKLHTIDFSTDDNRDFDLEQESRYLSPVEVAKSFGCNPNESSTQTPLRNNVSADFDRFKAPTKSQLGPSITLVPKSVSSPPMPRSSSELAKRFSPSFGLYELIPKSESKSSLGFQDSPSNRPRPLALEFDSTSYSSGDMVAGHMSDNYHRAPQTPNSAHSARRRFAHGPIFSEQGPTITSLLSPPHMGEAMTPSKDKYGAFMGPPPVFGQPRSSDLSSPISAFSRANSIASNLTGYARIQSSSSSLNLHAYLTDDPDDTLTQEDCEIKDMYQYLDRL